VKNEPILVIFGTEFRRNVTSENYKCIHLTCKMWPNMACEKQITFI